MNEKIPIPCEQCHGTGLNAGIECIECHGRGHRVVIGGKIAAPDKTQRAIDTASTQAMARETVWP